MKLNLGCSTYDKTPFWTPNGWNATFSTDKSSYETYYFGVNGALKHQ